jgi:hypothetical protein
VKSGGRLKILVTSNFRSGSDGGGLNIFPHVERGLKTLLEEQKAIGIVTEVEEEPETEEPFHYDKPGVDDPVTDIVPGTDMDQSESMAPQGSDHRSAPQGSGSGRKHRGRPRGSKGKHRSKPTEPPTNTPTVEPTVPSTESPTTIPTVPTPTRVKSPSRNAKTHSSVPIPADSSSGPDPKRSARIRDRMQRRVELGGVAQDIADLETACFADWSEHGGDNIYWSWVEFAFIVIEPAPSESVESDPTGEAIEEGYRAVTENVPKSFAAELVDPRWGVAAQKEINTIMSAKTMIKGDDQSRSGGS